MTPAQVFTIALLLFLLVPGVFALATVNFPQAENTGGYVELQWLALDNLTLGASLAHVDAELSQSSTLCFPDDEGGQVCLPPAQKGARLPLTPDWKATFSLDYTNSHQIWDASPFFRFDYSYVGESVNSLEGFESVVNLGDRSNTLPSYDEGNMQLGLESNKWTFTFSVDNVWDERAEQFLNNRWGSPRISISRPRTYGLTFRYNF